MLLETGDKILLEDGGSFIKEDYLPVNTDAQANNTYFTTTNFDDNIIDFSEINPFGEAE